MPRIILDERYHKEAGTAADPVRTVRGINVRIDGTASPDYVVADQTCVRTFADGRSENCEALGREAPGGRFSFTCGKLTEPARYTVNCVIRTPGKNEHIESVFECVPKDWQGADATPSTAERVDEAIHQLLKIKESL